MLKIEVCGEEREGERGRERERERARMRFEVRKKVVNKEIMLYLAIQ